MKRTLLGLLATLALFLTACSELDTTAVTELQGTLTPADEAIGVSVETDVSIEFVDPLEGEIAPEDVEASFTLTELDDAGEAVEGGDVAGTSDSPAFTQDENFYTTWTFTPAEALEYGTTYRAFVSADAGFTTEEGYELAGDVTWTFTTEDVPDPDDDGVPNDGTDNCPEVANPGQGDMDGDGTGDECDDDKDGDGLPNDEDPHPGDEDGDGDGHDDPDDNCPTVANPDQNAGDCTDGDGDGHNDSEDNCPEVHNPEQDDWNDNGVGDACEDSDGDGVGDADDPDPAAPGSAPTMSFEAEPETLDDTDTAVLSWTVERHHADDAEIGPEEEDFEVSIDTGIGAVAATGSREVQPTDETTYTLTARNIYGEATADVTIYVEDADGDGVPDGMDNCADASNPLQEDLDGDEVGDVCDPDRDGDGVGNEADPYPDTKGNAPTIVSFEADRNVVSDLDGVTLSWEVERDHDDATVEEGFALSIDNDVGDVTDENEVTVMTEGEIYDTTYTLTASNIYGEATADVEITVEDQDGDGIPDDEDDGYDGDPGEVPGCDLDELDGALCISYGEFEFDYDSDVTKGEPIVEDPPELVNGSGSYEFWFEASDADGFFELEDDGTITRGSSGNGSDFQDWQLRVYVKDLESGKIASVVLDFNLVE